MHSYSPYMLPPLMAGILNLGLVLWIFFQAAPSYARRSFMLWSFMLGLWNLTIATGYSIQDAGAALIWFRVIVTSIVRFLPLLFLQFVMVLTETDGKPQNRTILKMGYTISALFLVVGSTTSYFIKEVRHYEWGYYPLAQPGEMLFGVPFAASVVYAFYLLALTLRRSSGYRRDQLRYVLLGAAICFTGGATNFLPLYGVSVYPLGNLLNSVYAILVAIAITEYGLFDIQIMLRKSLIYMVMSGILASLYLLFVALFKRVLAPHGIGEEMLYHLAAVPMTFVLVPSIRHHIEPFLGQLPYWKSAPFQRRLGAFQQHLLQARGVAEAADRIVLECAEAAQAQSAALYLRQKDQNYWERMAYDQDTGPVLLDPDDPVIRRLAEPPYLWLAKNNEAQFPYTLAVPFESDDVKGFIALGARKSKRSYHMDDVQTLRLLAAPAATTLYYLRTLETAMRPALAGAPVQDMRLIGHFALEITHELARPMNMILQEAYTLEKMPLQTTLQDSARAISRLVQSVREILDGFVLLSPERPLSFLALSPVELLEESLANVSQASTARIRIERHYDATPLVYVNGGQIVQVFNNIIQNAYQAMASEGTLQLSTRRVELPAGPEVEIEIADNGPGIPPSLQSRIFDLFFSTRKARGGLGIGLALSQAIVRRHGGRFVLLSPVENNRGTAIKIYLPLEPPKGLL